ncbi:MAG: glycosyltransferase family 2 protein, partial [Caldilineaceae bacterium]|nr:glycosyltransferase family 2 protein [Caldilineaceae bacterium]
MSTTTSIVLIANTAEDLTPTVASLLVQTDPAFELLIVDRSGSAAVAARLRQFADRRIVDVTQAHGQGASLALATALRRATGAFVAFAAPGDTWHPTRLQRHVRLLETQNAIGATYNIRMATSGNGTHLFLWQPTPITLADLVLGQPLALSDLVVRRPWLTELVLPKQHDTAQEDAGTQAALASLLYQLALANCPFMALSQMLHQCRTPADQRVQEVAKAATFALEELETVFADPRCPPAVQAMRKRALGRANLSWSYQAFCQQESALGQSLLRSAIRYNRTILDVAGQGYRDFLARNAQQSKLAPAIVIQRQFTQLPPELAWLNRFQEQTVARGYLYQGAHSLLWGRLDQGRRQLKRAAVGETELDRPFLYELLHQLSAYEAAFGPAQAETALGHLTHHLRPLATSRNLRGLRSRYYADRALRHYR